MCDFLVQTRHDKSPRECKNSPEFKVTLKNKTYSGKPLTTNICWMHLEDVKNLYEVESVDRIKGLTSP